MTTKNKTKFSASMFDSLKDALKKSEGSGGAYTNIMKFPHGHTYTVRLIPNLESIADTFFHHYSHQWNSKATGKFISALSLTSFGERDPIAETRWKMYKAWKDSGPAKDEKFAGEIQQKEQWYANIFVEDDPSDPENNGSVKVIRLGPQLMDIIKDAMEGDRAEEFGARIFDLSKDGAVFKIKADKQGDYTTFIKSFFSNKSKLDLDDEDIEKIYESVHDLKQIQPVKTYEELQALLEEHFICGESDSDEPEERKPLAKKPVVEKKESPKKVEKTKPAKEEEEDDIPMSYASDALDEDDNIDELLAGLDD